MKNWFQKLFNRQAKKRLIIVSGLPRSGTSMMMKMLEAGGILAMTDNLRIADDDNPNGYYEVEQVKQLKAGQTTWLAEADGQAIKVISALLEYLPREHDYQIIFMQRPMTEILASQKQMLIRRGEPTDLVTDDALAVMYDKHLVSVSQWLAKQPNMQRLDLQYGDVLGDPMTAAQQVADFLGQSLNITNMAGVVDPTLYRQRDEG